MSFLAFQRAATTILRHPTTHPLARYVHAATKTASHKNHIDTDGKPHNNRPSSNPSNHTRRFPKNSQIKHPIVQVQLEDGTLSHPQKLSKVLASIDTATHLVMQVTDAPPTVRVVSKLEEKMRKWELKADRKKASVRRKIVQKEVQVAWATEGADFENKMGKVREELERGDVRVDLVVLPKRGVKGPSRREMEERLDEMVGRFVELGKEWKERSFSRGEAKVYLQSLVRREAQGPSQEEIDEKAMEELRHIQRVAAQRQFKLEAEKREWEMRQQVGLDDKYTPFKST